MAMDMVEAVTPMCVANSDIGVGSTLSRWLSMLACRALTFVPESGSRTCRVWQAKTMREYRSMKSSLARTVMYTENGGYLRLPETRLPPTRARPSFTRTGEHLAGVIQLVECQLPKLDVTGSSPVARSLEVVVTESLPRARARMGPGVFLTGPVSRVRRTRL